MKERLTRLKSIRKLIICFFFITCWVLSPPSRIVQLFFFSFSFCLLLLFLYAIFYRFIMIYTLFFILYSLFFTLYSLLFILYSLFSIL